MIGFDLPVLSSTANMSYIPHSYQYGEDRGAQGKRTSNSVRKREKSWAGMARVGEKTIERLRVDMRFSSEFWAMMHRSRTSNRQHHSRGRRREDRRRTGETVDIRQSSDSSLERDGTHKNRNSVYSSIGSLATSAPSALTLSLRSCKSAMPHQSLCSCQTTNDTYRRPGRTRHAAPE